MKWDNTDLRVGLMVFGALLLGIVSFLWVGRAWSRNTALFLPRASFTAASFISTRSTEPRALASTPWRMTSPLNTDLSGVSPS